MMSIHSASRGVDSFIPFWSAWKQLEKPSLQAKAFSEGVPTGGIEPPAKGL